MRKVILPADLGKLLLEPIREGNFRFGKIIVNTDGGQVSGAADAVSGNLDVSTTCRLSAAMGILYGVRGIV